MTYNRPVVPGEPLRGRLNNAAWFNSTLKKNKEKTGPNSVHLKSWEGELYCHCLTGMTERFRPVAVSQLAAPEIWDDRTPAISDMGITEFNWAVPQEDLAQNKGVRTVLTGLTRAWVDKINDEERVTYNPLTGRLETSSDGKAILLVHEIDHPSLITIESPSNTIGGKITWMAESIEYSTVEEKCEEQSFDGRRSLRAKVLRRPCHGFVYGEDSEGYVTVVDDDCGRFLEKRQSGELSGACGFASLMSGDYPSGCEWVIDWINWFEPTIVVDDVIIGGDRIIVDSDEIDVWRRCDLGPEETIGTDCPEDYQ